MGGFEVVSGHSKDPKWYPLAYNSGQTAYVGQLVTWISGDGVSPIATSSGTPSMNVPFGVIVGTNNRTPVYSSTYSSNSITAVATSAAQLARDFTGVEGVFSKGDPQAMVQVLAIDSTTVLRGKIFASTYGTALTPITASTAPSDGSGITTASITKNAKTYGNTWYGYTGKNSGIYRTEATNHATTHTFDTYWPYTPGVTDQFVYATLALGRNGGAKIVSGMFIDGYVATSSAYHQIDVLELNLADPANSTCLFRFAPGTWA